MARILVVEDDAVVGDMLEEMLRPSYEVTRAYSGSEAVLAMASAHPDLVLLDLMLPGRSGEEILDELLPTPVIVVSAKPDPEQKADLLFQGASDYVTKPFYPKELLARIAAQLRPKHPLQNPELEWAHVRLNTALLTAQGPDGSAHLTRTEAAILRLLMLEPHTVMAKSILLERLADETPDGTEASLKMHVSNLRKKLKGIGAPDYIEAVWGIGYKLRDA